MDIVKYLPYEQNLWNHMTDPNLHDTSSKEEEYIDSEEEYIDSDEEREKADEKRDKQIGEAKFYFFSSLAEYLLTSLQGHYIGKGLPSETTAHLFNVACALRSTKWHYWDKNRENFETFLDSELFWIQEENVYEAFDEIDWTHRQLQDKKWMHRFFKFVETFLVSAFFVSHVWSGNARLGPWKSQNLLKEDLENSVRSGMTLVSDLGERHTSIQKRIEYVLWENGQPRKTAFKRIQDVVENTIML